MTCHKFVQLLFQSKQIESEGAMKYLISILFLLLVVSNSKAETLNCLFEKIDEGPEVVTFEKEKGFYYATPLYRGDEFPGVGYKVIYNQDGFLTLARGVDESAEICIINKRQQYFECKGLTLNNEISGRVTGKCY